jgi:transcriptional regulator with XRE-family HTH domain
MAESSKAPPLLRRLVGDALRDYRVGQGRTLRDVAAAARVSVPYLSELERGRKEASSEVLAAVCRGLDVRLSDLLEQVRRELVAAEQPMATPRPAPAVPVQGQPAPARPRTGAKAPAARPLSPAPPSRPVRAAEHALPARARPDSAAEQGPTCLVGGLSRPGRRRRRGLASPAVRRRARPSARLEVLVLPGAGRVRV